MERYTPARLALAIAVTMLGEGLSLLPLLRPIPGELILEGAVWASGMLCFCTGIVYMVRYVTREG